MGNGRNITFILRGDFPEGNGSNSRIKCYAQALQKAGYEVALIYMWSSSFNDTGINTSVRGVWNMIYFRYVNNKIRRPISLVGKLFDTLKGMWNAATHVFRNRKKINLLYCYCPDTHYYLPVYLVAKLFRIPVITEQTELKSSLYLEKNVRRGLFYYLNRWDEKHTQWFSNGMIVISSLLENHYKNFFKPKALIRIPILTDQSRFENIAPLSETNTIGYVGSFGVKDGILGIILAFEITLKSNPLLKLHLIGYCENFENIRHFIISKGLQESIWLSGPVTFNQIPKLLGDCDTLVINRINSIYANHGFPTKLGEYLATGRPAIVTEVGDIKSFLKHKHDVYLVPPDNNEALAQAFINRYENRALFDEIGQNGLQTGQKYFASDIVGTQVVNAFDAFLSNSSS